VTSCRLSSNETARSLKTEKIEWLTSEEAARHLKIPVGSLRNLVANGKIPYYKFGRSNRYLRSELDKIVLAKKRGN